ncbi:hypothetical protein BCR39DRAFT_533736 [Naematelia encephala]|uniref:Nucleoporin Nup188 N-terminal subdomain III domain-containing protein n=1 Tax=Naematelia encephala TaxID=71784 RepID=A0A1Y2B1Z8_9TREE|nr:hypothetical protein BCR39DRAFT_533736 [Naematelia encephala]
MVQTTVETYKMELDDCIFPLTTIRDTLLSAPPDTAFPRLLALLKYHLIRLKSPWEPFSSPSIEKKSAVEAAVLHIPNSTVKISTQSSTRNLALKLSSRVDVDEVTAYLLVSSYERYSVGDVGVGGSEAEELDRVVLWWEEETLAIPQIVGLLIRLSESENEEWRTLGMELRGEILQDGPGFIEKTFRAWGALARRTVQGRERDHALFWATHQLRLQSVLVELLFTTLYALPYRPFSTSEALIRASVMSTFGTQQANLEIWEGDIECQALYARIRDQLLVIALESIGLSALIEGDEGPVEGTLLSSPSAIQRVHEAIWGFSEELAVPASMPREIVPAWPVSVLCLAWAIALRSLDEASLPATPGYAGDRIWQELMARSLKPSSGVFAWLEAVLQGALFAATETGEQSEAKSLRRVIKDLMMGLSESVQLEHIADRSGMYRVLDLLFGGGSPSTSSAVAEDYWVSDYLLETRRSLLFKAGFPQQASSLPRLLAALSAQGSSSQAARSWEYFSRLPTITTPLQAGWYLLEGRDEQDNRTVVAAKNLILPDGQLIPEGTAGLVVSSPNASLPVAMWRLQTTLSGWILLVEILRAALGMPKTASPTQTQESVHLSVADLGIEEPPAVVIEAGLKLFRDLLEPSAGLVRLLPEVIPNGGDSLVQVVLRVLDIAGQGANEYLSCAPNAIRVLTSLLLTGDSHIWAVLRTSSFFGSSGKRRIASNLIIADSTTGDHALTLEVIRLVASLAKTYNPEPIIIKAAIQLLFTEIWSVYTAWRFTDVAIKYQISTALFEAFDTILSHPLDPTGKQPTETSQHLNETLIGSASGMTYRPLVEIITQAGPLARKLIASKRKVDAALVILSLDAGIRLLETTIRIAHNYGIGADALPKSLLVAPILGPKGERITLVDGILDLVLAPAAQESTKLAAIGLLRSYILSTAEDSKRPSLAGSLRDAQGSLKALAGLFDVEDNTDVHAAIWTLLAEITTAQPGCAAFCAATSLDKIDGTLGRAVDAVCKVDESPFEPNVVSAILYFLQAVIQSPSCSKATSLLRKSTPLWRGVFDLVTRHIPPPPSFALSMHSEDFAVQIEAYAYATQAKANATALLAIEIRSSLEASDEGETEAQRLVLGLWRNGGRLQQATVEAAQNGCRPEVHTEMGRRLAGAGVGLAGLKSMRLDRERIISRDYFFDGKPVVFGGEGIQANVNFAIDMLNLAWFGLEADKAVTIAFRDLADSIADLTAGDQLAATASLRAAIALADYIAGEERGGDVMLGVQTERLAILAMLLDTALDAEVDVNRESLVLLAASISRILESQEFVPIASLRQTDLPAIHRPVLRILSAMLPAISKLHPVDSERLLEPATVFSLEAFDIILDAINRQTVPLDTDRLLDLNLLVGVLSETARHPSTSIWLDRMSEFNLFTKSLQVITRTIVTQSHVPPHLPGILMLHLALASNPASAERLAVSGVLPAYSDNAIAVEAEQARISSSDPQAHPLSIHSAWCGLLVVIKALLFSLPETARGGFTKSDVIPFIRVTTAQLHKTLAWDGESSMTRPYLDELGHTVDIFGGIASAIGYHPDLLADYSPHAVDLLRSLRFALQHPRTLASSFVPADEEEHGQLTKELEAIEGMEEVELVDFAKLPVIVGRVMELVRVGRGALAALIELTKAWRIVDGDDEVGEEVELLPDDVPISAQEDTVGVYLDLHHLAATMYDKMEPSTTEQRVAYSTLAQLSESALLLSSAQLLVRRELLPNDEEGSEMDMDVDSGKRRTSLGKMGEKERARAVLRELEDDLRGVLGVDEYEPLGGIKGFLREAVRRELGEEQ